MQKNDRQWTLKVLRESAAAEDLITNEKYDVQDESYESGVLADPTSVSRIKIHKRMFQFTIFNDARMKTKCT
jgi:hypothetical protein